MEICLAIKTMFTLAGASIGYFIGGWDGFLEVLLAFAVIDYLTGVINAFIHKTVSSSIGFKGIIKKVMIFLFVAMGHLLDTRVMDFDGQSPVRTAVIFFFIANEGISILENSSELGLPIPVKLKNALLQIRNEKDKK